MAILAVLAGHFIHIPGINVGRFGVELFFVLSGRLMAHILFIHKAALVEFYARRFSRVWPGLAVFATITTAVVMAVSDSKLVLLNWIGAVTFTSNYISAADFRLPWLEHVWSLCVEEHLYVLLGFLAFMSRRLSLSATQILSTLCVIMVAMMALGAILSAQGHDYFQVYWRSDVRGASILAGAAAYLLVRGLDERGVRLPAWLPIALGVAGVMLQANPVPDTIKYTLGTLLVAGSLATLHWAPKFALDILSLRVLTFFGLVSFSIYLWQQPFYILAALHSGQVGGKLAYPLMFAAAIGAGLVSYYLVEDPLRRRLNSLIRRKKPEPAIVMGE